MKQSYALKRDFNHPDTGERIRLEKPGLVEHVLKMYLARPLSTQPTNTTVSS